MHLPTRFQFALNQQSQWNKKIFVDMYDRIHVDEKWFELTTKHMRTYLAPSEPDPKREVCNKQHIPKLMFLGAVARPRYDLLNRRFFDGKLGLYVIGEQVAAKRDSVNCLWGTLKWKPLNMTKDLYKHYLLNYLVPAIVQRRPRRIYANGIYCTQKVFI